VTDSTGRRFSAFGAPLVPPGLLTHVERIELLRAAVARMRHGADPGDYVARWLAEGVERWLVDGGDMATHLGLRPPRGSRRTAAALQLERERADLLTRLSVAVGGDAQALRVLHGVAPAPRAAQPLLEALRGHRLPRSRAAFTRARVSRHPR
jgi:hypothetical protein